jgi:DNA-binding MarR family transcriptional regulator
MSHSRKTRSVAFNEVTLSQLLEIIKVTGENVNRLVNRLINEEFIRKIELNKKG